MTTNVDSKPDVDPVHHVSVKPPPFMETAVQGWFAVMDAQFFISKITSSATKFYHILSALPPDTIAHIPKEILDGKDFETLKTTVTDMYERTKPELFERLISKTRLTGRPSLFLSELREVAQKVGVGDDLLRHKFIQSLPAGIATALASQRELPLTQLGKLADELLPLVQSSPTVAHMAATEGEFGGHPHQPPYFQPAPFQPAQFQPAPCNMTQYQPRQRQSGPQRYAQPQTRSTSGASFGLRPYHEDQRPKVCRSHIFFGAKARTCKPWCQWPTKAADLTMQPSSRAASPARVPSNQEN